MTDQDDSLSARDGRAAAGAATPATGHSDPPPRGAAVEIAPGIRRVTAPNAGPLTLHGTNCYLIGRTAVTVVDPGPDDEAHVAELVRLSVAPVRAIVLTHEHADHVGAVGRLAALTGAEIVGAAPGAAARHPIRPDRLLCDGDLIATELGDLRAVATPGHTAGHFCFTLAGTPLLFSGDHVMGWSTSVVLPPDGSMADYMASLDRLAALPATLYLPGHGDPVPDGPARVAHLKQHRLAREAAIVAALDERESTVEEIVAAVYVGLHPSLSWAAALSVTAHLDWLEQRGCVGRAGERWRKS